jgi:hypothetical protein
MRTALPNTSGPWEAPSGRQQSRVRSLGRS